MCACGPESEVFDEPGNRYDEIYRPQVHFSPPENWMNDPNGMVYHDGEYHLFYQYHPESTKWGPMHWGHAISRDLVHWHHLPVALEPDSLGYIFSGSAVVDRANTSGLGSDSIPPLVAIYTQHDPEGEQAGRNDFQTQSIAYSTDAGLTWTPYAKNPVLLNPGVSDFRDPKVFWHGDSEKWIMTLAAGDHVRFYSSPDLKRWEHLSDFGPAGSTVGVWECPDLFPVSKPDDNSQKWVLLVSVGEGSSNGGSGTQYFIGNFDGTAFLPDADETLWIDYGRDNYAGVTWSNAPGGFPLFIGWMSNWNYAEQVPTAPWRGAMTLPRRLSLRQTDAGLRVRALPVPELAALRGASHTIRSMKLGGPLDMTRQIGFAPVPMEIELEFQNVPGTDVGVVMANDTGDVYRLGFDATENRYFSDRTEAGLTDFSPDFGNSVHYAPRFSQSGIVTMRVYLDRSSAELFADDGCTVMTDTYFPREEFNKLTLFVEGGKVEIHKIAIYALKPIW